MSTSILIGVDAGTSQIKCVAYSSSGEYIASRSVANEYKNLPEGGAEQSLSATREKVIQTLEMLVKDLGPRSQHVCAIAITAQGDGMLLTDIDGNPLHDGWLWLDSRAAQVASEIEQSQDYGVVFRGTGTAVNAAQLRSQLKWVDRNQPQLLDRAHTAYHWKDYLYFCLTGERAGDPSEALFTFGDIKQGDYSPAVIKALQLEHRQHLLPPIVDGLTTSHKLQREIAQQVGLTESTEVTLAFVDVICSALGGGLYNKGKASAITILGTTGIHMRYIGSAAQLQLPEERTGYTIAFPGGGFVQLQSNMAATMNLDWILGLGKEAAESIGHRVELPLFYEKLDRNLQDTKPSTTVFHPYIASAGERGPFVNVDARASFIGLEMQSGYYDLVRSVIEGLGYATRDCYEALGDLPDEIRLTGGAAKSRVVQQILASVLNRPVRVVVQNEAAAAGAAMMAAVKHGFYNNIEDCVDQWLGNAMGEVIQPVAEDAIHYDHLYNIYLDYRKTQPPTWSSLAAIEKRAQTI